MDYRCRGNGLLRISGLQREVINVAMMAKNFEWVWHGNVIFATNYPKEQHFKPKNWPFSILSKGQFFQLKTQNLKFNTAFRWFGPTPIDSSILSLEIIIAFKNIFSNIWYDFKFYITQKPAA